MNKPGAANRGNEHTKVGLQIVYLPGLFDMLINEFRFLRLRHVMDLGLCNTPLINGELNKKIHY
jgi:hypothetical protein